MKAGSAQDGTKLYFNNIQSIRKYGAYAIIVGRQRVATMEGMKTLFDLVTQTGRELQWLGETLDSEFKDLTREGN